jgi:hypothetical protein
LPLIKIMIGKKKTLQQARFPGYFS